MNHFYTMSGFPKPSGEALTNVARTYNFSRRWWAGERLPLVGDWLFDRYLIRGLTARVMGPRGSWIDWRRLGLGLFLVLGLGAWAAGIWWVGVHSSTNRPAYHFEHLDGGAR